MRLNHAGTHPALIVRDCKREKSETSTSIFYVDHPCSVDAKALDIDIPELRLGAQRTLRVGAGRSGDADFTSIASSTECSGQYPERTRLGATPARLCVD